MERRLNKRQELFVAHLLPVTEKFMDKDAADIRFDIDDRHVIRIRAYRRGGRRAYAGQSVKGLNGAWHHTEFDLGGMLLASRFAHPETRARITASELATWAAYHVGLPGNSEHARVRIDNVCLYSNRGVDPAFEWQHAHFGDVSLLQ